MKMANRRTDAPMLMANRRTDAPMLLSATGLRQGESAPVLTGNLASRGPQRLKSAGAVRMMHAGAPRMSSGAPKQPRQGSSGAPKPSTGVPKQSKEAPNPSSRKEADKSSADKPRHDTPPKLYPDLTEFYKPGGTTADSGAEDAPQGTQGHSQHTGDSGAASSNHHQHDLQRSNSLRIRLQPTAPPLWVLQSEDGDTIQADLTWEDLVELVPDYDMDLEDQDLSQADAVIINRLNNDLSNNNDDSSQQLDITVDYSVHSVSLNDLLELEPDYDVDDDDENDDDDAGTHTTDTDNNVTHNDDHHNSHPHHRQHHHPSSISNNLNDVLLNNLNLAISDEESKQKILMEKNIEVHPNPPPPTPTPTLTPTSQPTTAAATAAEKHQQQASFQQPREPRARPSRISRPARAPTPGQAQSPATTQESTATSSSPTRLPQPPRRLVSGKDDKVFRAWLTWRLQANKQLAAVILTKEGQKRILVRQSEMRRKPLTKHVVQKVAQKARSGGGGEGAGAGRGAGVGEKRGSGGGKGGGGGGGGAGRGAERTSLPPCPYAMYGIPRVNLASANGAAPSSPSFSSPASPAAAAAAVAASATEP